MLESASRVKGECRLRERDDHSSSLSRTRTAPSDVVLILEDANVDRVDSTLIERATLGRWLEDALEVVSGLVDEKRVFWLCRRNEARPTSAPEYSNAERKEVRNVPHWPAISKTFRRSPACPGRHSRRPTRA